MTIVPPDPSAAEQAELRSEDDGMPVHPDKSDDPVAYADGHVERARRADAGYPVGTIGRAYADASLAVTGIVDDLLAPKNRTVVAVAGLLGFGLAALLLEQAFVQPRSTRRRRSRW